MNADDLSQQPIVWVGSSHKDLRTFPSEVRRDIGFALYEAQLGGRHYNVKPLKGFPGVMEIVSDYRTDTYRAVYAVKLGDEIYVLHVFQKKSKRGIATPKKELDIIRQRLQEATRIAREQKQ